MDVGSGGGIPALPLAIASPDRSLSSLDATRKKVEFQTAAALELGLTNFTAYWGRAESFGADPQHRQSYDLVLARAVAATAVLAEFTLPFVKPGGYAMFYKGQDYLPRLNQAKHAVRLLGGQVERVEEFSLPEGRGERVIIIIKKVANTPALYPRKPGIPLKKPL